MYVTTFYMLELWNRFQGFDCDVKRRVSMANILDRIVGDIEEDFMPSRYPTYRGNIMKSMILLARIFRFFS